PCRTFFVSSSRTLLLGFAQVAPERLEQHLAQVAPFLECAQLRALPEGERGRARRTLRNEPIAMRPLSLLGVLARRSASSRLPLRPRCPQRLSTSSSSATPTVHGDCEERAITERVAWAAPPGSPRGRGRWFQSPAPPHQPHPLLRVAPLPRRAARPEREPLRVVVLVAAVQMGDGHVHIDGDGRWHGLAGAGGLQALQLMERAIERALEGRFVARE